MTPELVERVALAILNSDRVAAGWPAVESRDRIPDSEGYVRNATAALEAAIVQALSPELTDVEAEAALTAVGIHVWGPDGDRFATMFAAAMRARQALSALAKGGAA